MSCHKLVAEIDTQNIPCWKKVAVRLIILSLAKYDKSLKINHLKNCLENLIGDQIDNLILVSDQNGNLFSIFISNLVTSPDTLGHHFGLLDELGRQLGHKSIRSFIWSW